MASKQSALLFLLCVSCFFFVMGSSVETFAQPAPEDNINDPQFIPDPNFRAAAEVFLGKPAGGVFTLQEANDATGDFIELRNTGTADLTGIEFFINIDTLDASGNNLTGVDLSANTQLEFLDLSGNNLSALDITGLSNLEILRLSENSISEITGLELLNVPLLEELDLSGNVFSSLDVSQMISLRGLNIAGNSFDTLFLSELNLGLKDLDISNNNFASLDISNLKNLESLNASNNNFGSIGADGADLDLTANSNLIVLNISNNADLTTTPATPPTLDLTAIGSDFPAIESKLTTLDVSNNELAAIDITALRDLTTLLANDNNFSTGATPPFNLDTTFNPDLRVLNLSGNLLDGGATLGVTPLDLTQNTNLRILDLSDNLFGTSNVDSLTYLSGELAKIDPTPGSETLQEVDFSRNPLQGDGAGPLILDFSTNVTLTKINISRLSQVKATGLTANDINLTGLVNLVELNASFNPRFFSDPGVSGILDIDNPLLGGLDVPGTGSLEILNLEATGLGGNLLGASVITSGILVNSFGSAAITDGLSISDPTTITTLNLAGNELDFDDIVISLGMGVQVNNSELLQHSKLSGGKISTVGTGPRFDVLDLRNNRFLANNAVTNDASAIIDVRNIFLIETTARPDAQETTFDETGRLTNGVAFLPVREATGGFFSFESGVDPTKQIKLIFPNGGEQFDTTDFQTVNNAPPPNGANHEFAEVWSKPITLATNLNEDINLQVSTDGGASFTDLAGSPFAAAGTDIPEDTGIFLLQSDLQDANGDDINSSQVVFRAISSNDPTLFDTSDFFTTFNKGSLIQNIFTGLSLSFPTNLFVNPKGIPPTVEVAVNVSNPVGIDSYVLQFRFDPDTFFFVVGNVDTTGTASANFPDPVSTFNNQTGTLTIAAASVNPVPNSPLVPNTLIKFTLNAFSFAETGRSSDIELVSAVARINEEPVQVTNSSIFVVNTFLYGDVNGNGSVGVLDANEILRFAAFAVDSFTGFPNIVRPDFPGAADVDDNGVVGAGDAALVLRFVAGVITTFPADDNGDGIGPDPINPNAAKRAGQSTTLNAATEGNAVTLALEDTAGVHAFRFVLRYDPQTLALSDAVESLLGEGDLLVAHHDADTGTLVVTGATLYDLPQGPGALLRVPYTPLSEEPASIEIDLAQSNINDGAVSLSAQSDSMIELNGSTGLPAWMVY